MFRVYGVGFRLHSVLGVSLFYGVLELFRDGGAPLGHLSSVPEFSTL